MFRSIRLKIADRLADGPLLAIALIVLTALLTHGWMIPRLGYYYDDWYMLWSGASRGAGSLIPLFSLDRPFMGVLYSLMYRVIGDSIWGWHLSALFFRIAGGVAFYWILLLAWPKLKNLATLTAMIFVVFPGFLAEPNAATKINHLIGYSAALFSIALTLVSLQTSHPKWKAASLGLALFLMAIYVWLYEYMIGLEVMRVTLVFLALPRATGERPAASLRKTLHVYLPFLGVIGLFLIWRVFLFDSSRSATDMRGLAVIYYADFLGMTLRLVFQVVKDFLSAALFAWFAQPHRLLAAAEYGAILTALLVALLAAALSVVYVFAARKDTDASPSAPSPSVLILSGSLIVLGAVFPVVLSNRSLDLMDAYKSYALHPSAGALILLLGVLHLVKEHFRKMILVVLLALSAATQSLNSQVWANFWEIQRGFWWQLTWRAPDIRDNALVIGVLPDGYPFREDYEIWGPLNLIYRPGPAPYPAVQAQILTSETMADLLARSFLEPHVRDIYVPRYYSNPLIISQPATGSCIHVIDGKLPVYSPDERAVIEKIGGFSDLDFIDPTASPAVPPPAIFGREPEHGWCFYYQRASLARQTGDWQRIGDLFDAAASAGLKAADSSEYFVFIEGLTNLGRVEDASELAEEAILPDFTLKYSLCQSLANAPDYPPAFGYRKQQIRELVCQ